LASRTAGRDPNLALIQSIVGCSGRVYIHEMSPRAKKFFDRSASRGFTPNGSQACRVIEVIGTSYTLKALRSSPVSGSWS
jgi:hypothetical protein